MDNSKFKRITFDDNTDCIVSEGISVQPDNAEVVSEVILTVDDKDAIAMEESMNSIASGFDTISDKNLIMPEQNKQS